MSQLPCYESYKNSGVQWLGEIPSHWEVKRMKFLLSEKLKYGANESAESEDKDQPRYIRITDINDSGTLREDTFKSLEIEKAQEYLLNDLDILLARSGATVGKSYLHKKDKVNVACYAGYLIRARFNKENYDPQFINLFLQSKAYWSWIESVNIQATIQNVSAEKYNDLALSIPSLAEQKIIADFLDKRLAQVDALIAKQETLLEKLAEQRVALISHAVTKGLNPDVEMKESGVEWLGQVPSHWIDTKFKYYVYFQEGPGILAVDFRTEGVPLIRISGLKDNTVTLNGCNFLDENKVKETWNHFKLTKKDMIISASASLSEACEVTDEAIGAIPYTGLIKVRPQQESLLKSYLKIFLSSRFFYEQVSILQTGATIQHYGPAHLRQISILVPPIEEQAKVVEHVEKAVSEINALTSKVVKTLETLREYRSTLITQVVTGKIDVRNLKIN